MLLHVLIKFPQQRMLGICHQHAHGSREKQMVNGEAAQLVPIGFVQAVFPIPTEQIVKCINDFMIAVNIAVCLLYTSDAADE